MSYYAYPWGRWLKWIAAGVVLLLVLGGGVSTYNGFTVAEQRVNSQWSQVENVMQSRADKIENLVEVVKGYVKHEEKVFGDIAAARSALLSGAAGVNTKLEADATLVDATRRVLVLAENYPELKADQQFHDLSVVIEGSENRVAVERKRFIEEVQAYNTKVTRFPGNLFARVMGFEAKEYFQASPGAQEAPKVKF